MKKNEYNDKVKSLLASLACHGAISRDAKIRSEACEALAFLETEEIEPYPSDSWYQQMMKEPNPYYVSPPTIPPMTAARFDTGANYNAYWNTYINADIAWADRLWPALPRIQIAAEGVNNVDQG